MRPVPVFMYHHVSPLEGDMVTITPEDFEAHLRFLKEGGYRTPSLGELVDYMEGRGELSGRSAVLTFDDGYLDFFIYAFPLLKKYGLRAAVFVVTDWADSAEGPRGRRIDGFRENTPDHARTKALIEEGRLSEVVMDWEMIEEMAGSGLVEFHSHTASHIDCAKAEGGKLAEELARSKARIEEKLGVGCDLVCWPWGRFNDAAVGAAREAGYRGAFTTHRGVAKRGDDPFCIKRIVVKEGASWFRQRTRIYTSPVMSGLYLRMRG